MEREVGAAERRGRRGRHRPVTVDRLGPIEQGRRQIGVVARGRRAGRVEAPGPGRRRDVDRRVGARVTDVERAAA